MRLPLLLAFLSSAVLLFLYGEKWLRAALLYLAGASWARQLVTSFPPAWYVASRFVSGNTREDAIAAARALNEKGMQVTLDYLGESVSTPDEARAARDEILGVLDTIHESGVSSTFSVKLTQLGLKLDPELCYENLCAVVERARHRPRSGRRAARPGRRGGPRAPGGTRWRAATEGVLNGSPGATPPKWTESKQ